ncbi:hypothetical protein Rleg_6568 (plasmid) [Rhizobium leguminosarum bv. trifolii WSM1325]|uniref:Lipoprotein n=1 Tax=Rhizobium leguminosarum bv. trifolii (strain WSM1325) TaxID=395491 RepID=C6BB50_RHILS|nr:hypothetical protein [Rhizobium leguminosarum]ACS61308.1 hypothetical protein Rleg_6568 [Rhizobium leguminosarum bv. trifolii WSM1325]
MQDFMRMQWYLRPHFVRVRLFCALLSLIALAACATRIQPEDLKSLNTSFAEAQKAGDLLYDETAKVIASRAKQGKDSCGTDAAGVPTCFNPQAIGGGRNEDPSVAVRRLALQLLTEYSLALVELSEGKSADELKSSINDIAAAASGIVAIAGVTTGVLPAVFGGPIVSSLSDLAGDLERARSAEAIRRSLLQQRETIAQLIDALIADTPQMYKIYYLSQQLAVLKASGAEITAMRQNTTAYHDSLAAYVALLRQAKVTHTRLATVARTPSNTPADFRMMVEEAANIQAKADTFWDAVRKLRN